MSDYWQPAPSFFSPTKSRIARLPLQRSPNHSSPRATYWRDDGSTNDQIIPTLPLTGRIPRITPDTLADLLNGTYHEFVENFFVIDCRYPYEYDGGHINGAVNVKSPDELFNSFFEERFSNAVLVFHCEFSQNRGPEIAGLFREIDRDKNKLVYPALFYPNVYILDGGYREFFADHPELCDGGYTPMLDDTHRTNGDLGKATTAFRKSVAQLTERHRKPLGVIQRQGTHQTLKSPMGAGNDMCSPVASKMLQFNISPIQPRRL
jgi:M-phase inducer tyrosine phosphatase